MKRACRRGAPMPTLVHKSLLFDPANKREGGVYLWKTLETGKSSRDAAWSARIAQTFGGAPTFDYFESPVVIDNAGG
jgi:hypothetical protein